MLSKNKYSPISSLKTHLFTKSTQITLFNITTTAMLTMKKTKRNTEMKYLIW